MLLTRDTLPETITDIASLDELLCRPSQALIDDLRKLDGDIMILGVAGKMGPTLAALAKAALPDRRIVGVARFSEAGVKGYSVTTWYVLFAPARTPPQVINKLNDEIVKALKLPDVQERLKVAGVGDIVGSSPAFADKFVRSEFTRWEKVIRAAGAKAD